MTRPVLAQIAGAAALSAGIGLAFGPPWFLISGGVCAIIGGAVAELTDPPRHTDIIIEDEGSEREWASAD